MVVELPLYGRYNIENFLAAAAVAWSAGVSLPEIARGATQATPASMRGVVRSVGLAGGVATVVDDSYNSNPSAVERALESASRLPGGRHWAVLGEMRELGDDAREFHRQLGVRAAKDFAPIVGVGTLARDLVETARAAGAEASWYPDATAAAAALAGCARTGRRGAGQGLARCRTRSGGAGLRRKRPRSARSEGRGAASARIHLLYPLHDAVPLFNVFRYITFRAAGAALTALVLSLVLGPWMIETLRKLSVGQSIRDVGPADPPQEGGHSDHGRPADPGCGRACRRCSGGT